MTGKHMTTRRLRYPIFGIDPPVRTRQLREDATSTKENLTIEPTIDVIKHSSMDCNVRGGSSAAV